MDNRPTTPDVTSFSKRDPDFEKKWIAEYAQLTGDLNLRDGIGYDCPICKNKGNVLVKDPVKGLEWRECECIVKRENIRRVRRSGLTNIDRYRFDNFEAKEPWQKTLLDCAISYALNPKGWFFIGGQVGCGKTHLCTAICSKLFAEKRGLYFMWRSEAVRLKTAAVSEPDYYAKRVGEAKTVELLYIDDLFKAGANNITAADINLAFEIINHRYVQHLTTIISTELSLAEIGELDEAVSSRIYEMCERSNRITIPKDEKKNHRMMDGVVLT